MAQLINLINFRLHPLRKEPFFRCIEVDQQYFESVQHSSYKATYIVREFSLNIIEHLFEE